MAEAGLTQFEGWAARTMLTTGGTTKRIDRLEKAGLVSRTRADADGRGRMVTLTAAGRDVIDRAFTEHMLNERRHFRYEERALLSVLDTLVLDADPKRVLGPL